MRYEDVEPISKAEAEVIFAAGNGEQITRALIGLAYYEDDWKWVQAKCLYYIESERQELQDSAILCLGHLARIHRQLDMDRVMPVLTRLKANLNLRDRVENTLDDIDTFIAD